MELIWTKSSYSATEGDCVEVAALADGGHAVRDSKDRDGPVLWFTAGEWQAFLRRIKPSDRPAKG